MTWRAQRRKKTTQKRETATMPRTAIRTAICGVMRYGSSTPGVGGRKTGGCPRLPALANRAHLHRPALLRRRREEPSGQPVHRGREQEGEQERRQPERPERGRVEDEPGPEAPESPEDGPAEQADRDEQDEDDLRVRLP